MLLRLVVINLFLLGWCISTIQGQRLYLRTYAPYFQENSHQITLQNGDFVVVGNILDSTILSKRNLLVTRFNPCGDVVWSYQIANAQASMDAVGLKLGANNTILIAGNFHLMDDKNLFLTGLNLNGRVTFFKRFVTGTDDLAFSIDLSPTNEIYLFFYVNVGESGPNNQQSLIKLDNTANLLWYKQFGFSDHKGEMTATSDGGVLISNKIELYKMDASGNMSWTKTFTEFDYSQHHFEVPNGYVFFKYKINPDIAYPLMLNKDGSIKWRGQRIPYFQPTKGLLRSNGNLLYTGSLYDPALGGSKLSFLEIDTRNGNIINTAIPYHQFSSYILAHSLNENTDSSITFSGTEGLTFAGGQMIGRISKDLKSISCIDTMVNLNYPLDTINTNTIPNRTVTNGSLVIDGPTLLVNTFTLRFTSYLCAYKTPLSMDIGEDTILCPGNSLILQPIGNQVYDFYLWSTGQTTKSISVDTAGTYWLMGVLDCDTVVDSINVSYHTIPEFDLGKDTTICLGTSFTLSANGHIAVWSTGDTAVSISVNQAGNYWANVSSTCGVISDSIQIDFYPQLKAPNLGNDTVICFGTKMDLSVDPLNGKVKWSTNEVSPTIQVDKSGTYYVAIFNICDTVRDTIQITVHPEIIIDAAVKPETAKVLDSIYFEHMEPKNFASLLWAFGDGKTSSNSSTVHTFSKSGRYIATLQLTDKDGCSANKDFEILINDHEYFVPNVFTPNGDGINEEFGVYGKGISNIDIQIFSRWGNRIYASSVLWEGKNFSGEPVASGTYFYIISFDQIGKQRLKLKGEISLLR